MKIGEKLMNWRNQPATKKQLLYIMRMQEDAGINGALPLPIFNGKTKGEASDYINENQGKQFKSFNFESHGDNYGDRI